jgi:hypothetical protein
MAEYSRLASGTVLSAGGDTVVAVPFLPDFIEISNATAAQAGAGITRAWWLKNMGQGAAFRTLFGTGDQYIDVLNGTIGSTAGLTDGTGFKTIQAGISLQYGPVFSFTTGTFTISKAANALVTTSVNHNLVSGNVIIFANLFQTATTGMQQLAGIPFVVTVTGATTFTICWDTSGSNYTAFDSATSLNNAGSWKKVLYPALYVPGVSFICDITLGATTTVTTTAPHNFVVGQEVAFRIPSIPGVTPPAWGPTELNSLPNVLIPGSPIYGYVVAVTDSTTVVVNIDSTAFTAFNNNFPFLSFVGRTPPQIVAVGDVNTGGWPISVGSDLYPSPLVFDGFSTTAKRTINGPAIQGAYINNTFMGFVIGSGVAGDAEDVLFWRAYMHDKNYP